MTRDRNNRHTNLRVPCRAMAKRIQLECLAKGGTFVKYESICVSTSR